jgi:LPS-assembly protein
MARRVGPGALLQPASAGGGRASVLRHPFAASVLALVFSLVLVLCCTADAALHAAWSQGTPPEPAKTDASGKTADAKPQKMFVEAAELVYNKDKNTVSAEGNARVYYKGSVLQADRVVYDRNTGRVYAEGHAELHEADGTIIHADRFDLTEDFRDGFIQSLRADTLDRTHISAPQAERSEGNITVYDKGTYTACDSCREDPEKPPLWRVRAKRIIHNNDEQMLYYQDATLEFFGIPVIYTPFFSGPDPSVKHKSGLLAPDYLYNERLGFGFGIPVYWALAPSYDLTVTPTVFTRQGFFGDALWRQKFDNGSYYIRADGIFQQDPSAFPLAPFGASYLTARGSIESKGALDLSSQWKFGWDFSILSDKFFITDYAVPNQTLSSNYYSEIISDIYLTGQSQRTYFDLRGYHFEGLAAQDVQVQQPLALPVLDYNRTIDVDPAKSSGIGGQITIDLNSTTLTQQIANFQAVGQPVLDSAFGLHQICTFYTPGNCLLRGIGGDYTRLTSQVSWQRKLIDPVGGVWSPFVFARMSGEALALNADQSLTFSSTSGSSTIFNASQGTLGANSGSFGNAMPGVGVEYRYPMIAKTPYGALTLEPIGQIIARPDEGVGSQPPVNMDSQSLVFDDTTLFAWDKNSGYDRFETGVRANYGGQTTFSFNNGGYVNFIGGQSFQVAGLNSYALPSLTNIGLQSGLESQASDYVGGLTFAPNSALSFIAKGRFDVTTFEPERIDLITKFDLAAWTGSIQYADYVSQPLIGYPVRREGLNLASRYRITDHYFVEGNVTFDMSREFYPASIIGVNPGPFAIAALGAAAGYQDECTTFNVKYISNYTVTGPATLSHNQTVLVQLQLRTLGQTQFQQGFLNYVATDSIR